ncbi:unnamed protein product [Gongylonema pulchrum]|uniref:G_PROTEIN_RECEP_F1_2 domain-containing protein n=1 Tax=Gongylonema pulchrum TaxID=637853 RepID=A0A183CUQ4_9BILA|nr:unnamed protein product [Gongylonema pulchrum]
MDAVSEESTLQTSVLPQFSGTEPYTTSQTSLFLSSSSSTTGSEYMNDEEPPEWCTILSVDCECHMSYQFYAYEERLLLGLITLPIIIFGLCANITSIRIFTHRLMFSSSINWYLAILSSSDTLILFSAFFVLSLPRLGEYTRTWSATRFRFGSFAFSIPLLGGSSWVTSVCISSNYYSSFHFTAEYCPPHSAFFV